MKSDSSSDGLDRTVERPIASKDIAQPAPDLVSPIPPAPRQTVVPRPSDRIAAPSRQTPAGVTAHADLCPLWVLWQDRAAVGNVAAVRISIDRSQTSGSFTVAPGYQVTYKESAPRLRWTGDTQHGTTTINSDQPILWLVLCARML